MDFSTVFIPQDSVTVRQAAAEAYAYSQKDNLIESHFYSTAYATKAVAVSFFSAFSYVVRSFGHVITHGAELDFKGMIIDFGKDNFYALQSILLSAFGTFYVGCALLLPKVVFHHFAATPPLPPRNLLAEVHTLTLQNQQLAGALYVEGQGNAQNAFALQLERNARNVERVNSFGAIAYLDAETKRISAEKAQEINQRGILEYQYSQLMAEKAAAERQLEVANQNLFAASQQNAQDDLRIAQLTHEKAQTKLRNGVLRVAINHRTGLHAAATTKIDVLTQEKAVAQIEAQHQTNVLAFRTHERNQAQFGLGQVTHDKAIADIQLTDLKNQLLYHIHLNNIAESKLARISDEKGFVDIQLADLRNQLLYQTHQKNVAKYKLGEITRDKTIAEIQVVDLKNQILYRTHMGNIAQFNAAQLAHDNAQLRVGNAAVANLQNDLHAAEARILAATNDLANERITKAQADLRITDLTREKNLAQANARQLTMDKAALQAAVTAHPDLVRLQRDLDQAQQRTRELEGQIVQVRTEKQQSEDKATHLDGQVALLKIEKGQLEALLAAHPDLIRQERSLEQAEERVKTLTDDFAIVSREKNQAEAAVQTLTVAKADALKQVLQVTDELKVAKETLAATQLAVHRIDQEKEQVVIRALALSKELDTTKQAQEEADRKVRAITAEKDKANAEVARLDEQSKQMGAQLVSTTQAKAQAETIRSDIQRQLDTAKEEHQRLQTILAVKPLKEINTPQDLATSLGSMQKADTTRLPQDLPVHQILHETDDHMKSLHNQKSTLETAFTKASSDKKIPEKERVVFQVDGTKFENGELLFAHLSTHSPDKDSKKTFPTEVLCLVHSRQQMLDKYVLPLLKEKLDTPNLGLTIEQANAPVTITIKTNVDRTQPVIMTFTTNYLLKKHSDATDQNGSAQISGIMTLTLHKPKYEGLVQRRVQNPDEKASCSYKIDKINTPA